MKHGLFEGIRQPSGDDAMSLLQWRGDGVVGLKMRMLVARESRDDVDLNLNPHANEKWLLHGTTWATVDPLVLQGFDHRLSGRGLYGPGTYLATDWWKAHQYYGAKPVIRLVHRHGANAAGCHLEMG